MDIEEKIIETKEGFEESFKNEEKPIIYNIIQYEYDIKDFMQLNATIVQKYEQIIHYKTLTNFLQCFIMCTQS